MTSTQKRGAEMSNAPKSIWAQDAQPDECDYTGGGWWDDACGNTQYSHTVEYVRADTHQAEIERLTAELKTCEMNCRTYQVMSTEAIRRWEQETTKEVKIKPLEWFAVSEWHHIADNPFGECWVKHYAGQDFWTVYAPGHYGPGNNFPSLEAAISTIQADYEARILACIEKGGDA